MSDDASALETMSRPYRELFDAIPCAVAEVDSRSLFETARALTSSGVTDYEAYLTAHPDINNRTRDGLRFITANAEFLRMVGARHETDVLGPIARFLPQTSHCAKFIAACAAGESRIQAAVWRRWACQRFEPAGAGSCPPAGKPHCLPLPQVRPCPCSEGSGNATWFS